MGIGEWEIGRAMNLGEMVCLFILVTVKVLVIRLMLIRLGEFFIFRFLFDLTLFLLDQGL